MTDQGEHRPTRRQDLRAALVVAVGVLLLGPVAGLVWYLVAPTARAVLEGDAVYLVDPESSVYIAADGWFALVATVAGLLCAVVAFARYKHNGVAALLALTAGGFAAGYLAARTGSFLGPAELKEQVKGAKQGTFFDAPLELRSLVALVAWPIASVSGFMSLTVVFIPPPYRHWPPEQDDDESVDDAALDGAEQREDPRDWAW